MNKFCKDRDEALRSLDKNKIFAYMNKYAILTALKALVREMGEIMEWAAEGGAVDGIMLPDDAIMITKDRIPSCEDVFWAGVHMSRIALNSFSEEEKEISREWLTKHGYTHEII